MSNENRNTIKITKILFIIGAIAFILAIIMAIICNNSYKEYWNCWDTSSMQYRNLEKKWEATKIGTIISMAVTDTIILTASIIQFVKSKKNKNDIIKLIIGIIAIVIVTVVCIFVGKLN